MRGILWLIVNVIFLFIGSGVVTFVFRKPKKDKKGSSRCTQRMGKNDELEKKTEEAEMWRKDRNDLELRMYEAWKERDELKIQLQSYLDKEKEWDEFLKLSKKVEKGFQKEVIKIKKNNKKEKV